MEIESHENILKCGSEAIAQWRRHHPGQIIRAPGAALAGVDLGGANLCDADLYGADLSGACLEKVDLQRANLEKANLDHAQLGGASLCNACLTQASLRDLRIAFVYPAPDFSGADLARADLSHAWLDKAIFRDANLRGANLEGSRLLDVVFTGADLRDAKFTDATISGACLSDARVFHRDLRHVARAWGVGGCCLCGREASVNAPESAPPEWLNVQCPRCGSYRVSWSLAIVQIRDKRIELENLSPWIRQQVLEGLPPPYLTPEHVQTLLDSLPVYRPRDKMNLLLRAIERRTPFPGAMVELNWDNDCVFAWCSLPEEAQFYLDSLLDRRLVSVDPKPRRNDARLTVQVTAEGFDYLEKHHRSSTLTRQVFVAMSFAPELLALYAQGLRPAIEKAGYVAFRVDDVPHTERIDARVTNAIQDSRFLVADATGARPNVFYEAGFAHGLGKTVIWTVQDTDYDAVPFDTRQYPHVIWTEPSDLIDELSALIRAVVG